MAAPSGSCRKYLVQFAHEHLDFRILELVAIGNLFGTKIDVPKEYDNKCPYMVIDLPSEDIIRKLASRTILVKSFYELWGHGPTYEALFQSLKLLSHEFVSQHLNEVTSFRIRHDSFNKQLTLTQKIQLVEKVMGESGLMFPGKINLSSPDQSLHLLEYYGRQDVAMAPDNPEMLYFVRWIADGHRDAVKTYDLKKRKFIGNTSMDAALAMIMTNMGHVCRNRVIYDPFVGTGSLLVASAHFGGYVMGTEIDWRLLHGRGRSSRSTQKWRSRDENIRNNLVQYNLDHLYLDAMVADASKHTMWRPQALFDAIITDPPYGIREPTKKVGTTKEDLVIQDEHKDGHIPSKVPYDLSHILLDLLNFAAKFLTVGGRLVYWLPVYRDDYVDENVPCHPCLRLMANSEQTLNAKVSRRLITMQKTLEYKEELYLAELPNDHYKDASFRDKYFRPTDEGPREKKQRKPRGKNNKNQPRINQLNPDRSLNEAEIESQLQDLTLSQDTLSQQSCSQESPPENISSENISADNSTAEPCINTGESNICSGDSGNNL